MEYTAVIKEISWHPMRVINSILLLAVRIPSFNYDIWIREEAPEEQLCQKYEIKGDPDGWVLGHLLKRRCLVAQDDRGFRFIKFLE